VIDSGGEFIQNDASGRAGVYQRPSDYGFDSVYGHIGLQQLVQSQHGNV
jgi:hypothetical protein